MQWLSPVLGLKWTPRFWKCYPRSRRKCDFKKDTWILDTLYNVARHQYLHSAAFDEVTFSEWRIDESLSSMISYSQCDIEQQPLLPHNFDAISLLICINWNCHYTSDRRATPTTNEPSMEHIPWKMQSLIKANYHQRLIIAWVLRRCNSGQI